MSKSIGGYNAEAKKGKDAATKYLQLWQNEITVAGAGLASDLAGKKLSLAAYNLKRDELNKQTKDLNQCIGSINKQFGG